MSDSESAPLALAVYAGETTRTIPLPPGARVTVGRAEGVDVRLDDASVSRAHAVFHAGPPVKVEDLGSANGTVLHRASRRGHAAETAALERLSGQRAALGIGDAVGIGGALFVLRRLAERPLGAGQDAEVVAAVPAMRTLLDQVARAAQGSLSVLLLGETGVGKDVVARFLHRRSPRASKPFLALHCAAIPETMLEAELFGHEKGAFTGASQSRAGLVESADGGTVFLDEIGELPLGVQVKLLRVLEQREVLRVGARAPKRVDVRFVAATNRDLEQASARGDFRQDLYFRLAGISFHVPPLRERRAEIPELCARFLAGACASMDRERMPTLTPAARAALERWPWPGNVRELRNVVERAVVLADDVVDLEHLPPKIAGAAGEPEAVLRNEEKRAGLGADVGRLRREMADAERQAIVDALAKVDGHQGRAAELLGMSRRTLLHRLDEYGIDRPRKR